jgi:pre-mRNA-processing factor 6
VRVEAASSVVNEKRLKEAERCESEASPRTCVAIVKATAAMELEDGD